MLRSRFVRSLLLMGSCLFVLGSECDPELLQLICADDPSNPQCREDNFVFVTSTVHQGDLGGLAGADAICNDLAANSSIASVAAGTYVAWLSAPGTNARDRISDTGGFIRTDGEVVATTFGDLLDGFLERPIRLDENGDSQSGSNVWTGTDESGFLDTGFGGSCDSWMDGSIMSFGLIGRTGKIDKGWTDDDVRASCSFEFRLYCFEM